MINENMNISEHDERDPNPWLALYLDDSIPINKEAKLALMRDNSSKSVRYLLPIIQVWSKLTMFFFHIFKFFFPKLINSSKFLHRILAWGLKRFVSRDANLLIFRHFHVGTEILQFIAGNIPGISVNGTPLKPQNFEDVKDDLFLKHDLNLYNFVIRLNSQLKEKNISIQPPEKIN
ncbi:MAG: hypothetical protein KJ941_10415, partial [Bacteroidetes bacterium]|nr:hypothetical protein [Bacteroidota bacterium]